MKFNKIAWSNMTAVYNFYAASEIDEASLHKAWTKSVGFFAVLGISDQSAKKYFTLYLPAYLASQLL